MDLQQAKYFALNLPVLSLHPESRKVFMRFFMNAFLDFGIPFSSGKFFFLFFSKYQFYLS